MRTHWLRGTSYIAYQAPDTPTDPDDPDYVAPQGDPHGDEVLEGGPPEPPAEPELPLVPETPPVAADPPTPPEPPAKPKTDWKDKEMARRARRIDEERTRANDLEARAKRAEDLAESLSRQPPPPQPDSAAPPPAPRQPVGERVYTKAELDAEAARIANAQFQQRAFQSDFDGAYQAGSSQFGKAKMDEAIARIGELGGLDFDHLKFVLATEEPGKVIYDLGSKPEEFQRIMELPFEKRAMEFAKMGFRPDKPPAKPSGAPPPVEPIGGGGGPTDNRYDDKASDDAWFAAEERRSEQYHKRKRNY